MSYALHIVPVGLSLRSRIEEARVHLPGPQRKGLLHFLDPNKWQSQVRDPSHPFRQLIRRATDPTTKVLNVGDVLNDVPDPIATAVQNAHAVPSLCSEWQSLHIESTAQSRSSHDGDAYLFLATDTDAGLLTATAVATGTANGRSIHFVDNPNESNFRSTRITANGIYICRIPNLDLSAPNSITDATWRALGSVGHVACETARESTGPKSWRIIIHLSGGYKAQLPSLLVMAEAIKSVLIYPNGHGATITAWTLHKDSTDPLYENRVEIAIRHLHQRAYDELYIVRAKVSGGKPILGADNLIGSCLDDSSSPTPFGRIMLAVIPETNPANV